MTSFGGWRNERLGVLVVRLGSIVFSVDTVKSAYRGLNDTAANLPRKVQVARTLLRLVSKFYPIERLAEIGRRSHTGRPIGFGKTKLDHETHRIFDLPQIQISKTRPAAINVLVPAFSIETISAGFFGVFAFALFCAKCGYHTRLVLFDNFYFDIDTFRKNLRKFPAFADMLERVELVYIGARYMPLLISDRDIAVATVWYSAYLAEKIRKHCGAKHFIYLVQDYEPAFHPNNSSFVLADNSYRLPAVPWISTAPLQQFFAESRMYDGDEWSDWCTFNNACSPSPDVKRTLETKRGSLERNFVFYCRPEVARNLFHLGALALIKAFESGIFHNGYNWRFHGIGIGSVEVYLDAATKLVQLSRMPLEEYQAAIGRFDVGLSLMGSPHPSLVPFDLAASGSLVVTNSFRTKTSAYFSAISSNIICKEPTLDALVQGIGEAVERSADIDGRVQGAQIRFPTSWPECWTARHEEFLELNVESAFARTAIAPLRIAASKPSRARGEFRQQPAVGK